jgi:Rrf2 family protein
MSLFSRKVDYALLILSHLHQKREGGCAREIADRYGLSKGFVANILKELCANGLVTSHRGVKGGYALRRPAEEVRLADLIDTLDGPFRLAECTGVDVCAQSGACPVKHAVADVHDRILAVLREVTLAELFRPRPAPSETQYGLELRQLVAHG